MNWVNTACQAVSLRRGENPDTIYFNHKKEIYEHYYLIKNSRI